MFFKPKSIAQRQTAAAPRPSQKPDDIERISIGGIKLPFKLENRGFIFSGAPGVGKSVAVTAIMDTLNDCDYPDFGLVSDRSGIYTARYYRPGRDAILNPLDSRAEPWSPLSEFEDEYSAYILSRAIVPDGEGSGAEWNGYAQSFLQAILSHCWRNGLTNADVLRLAIFAKLDELDEVLANSPAAGLIGPGAEKMFASVRAIVSSHMLPFSRLDPSAGRDSFSIRQWVSATESRGGWLFWNYTTSQMYPLRPLIAAQVDVFCEAVMTLPPDEARRAWLVLDEFSSIGRISSIENYVTNARKHGGCSILGMQSISQINALYGEHNASSILSSVGSSLILRTADAKTAEYLSQQIGDHQIVRWIESRSSGQSSSSQGGSSSNTQSSSQQIAIERIYLPSQLMKMPDLHGILNIAATPVTEVDLPLPQRRAPIAAPFEPRQPQPAAPHPASAADPDAPPDAPPPADMNSDHIQTGLDDIL